MIEMRQHIIEHFILDRISQQNTIFINVYQVKGVAA